MRVCILKFVIKLIMGTILLSLLSSCDIFKGNYWKIESPAGNILVEINLDKDKGELFYNAKYKNNDKLILERSSLGFGLENYDFFKGIKNVRFSGPDVRKDDYELSVGKKRIVNAEYNEGLFTVLNESGISFNIIFRVFNDGFAFRYILNEMDNDSAILVKDFTTFKIPEPGKCWLQPYDLVTKWSPGYERTFTNGGPIGVNAPDSSNGWCMPMLFEVDDTWILISESDLDSNNCGMHISEDCSGGEYKIAFPVFDEAMNVCGNYPAITFPWTSTWRAVIIGELSTIFESTMITDLAAKTDGDLDETWIIPGNAAWSWWSVSDSPKDFKHQKEYIDFASQMGWEYSLIDANWNRMKGGNVEQLAEYAASKNVGLLLWYNSGGPHNIVEEEPRDRMHSKEKRRKEFNWMKSIGIKGIKVDFFQSDKKCIIKQYHEILSDALDYELLVNFHGCTVPRGWNRTYPNLMTMEAVRGGEVYKFGRTWPDEAPVMNTVYPFSRNVVGSMDYTPVTFSDHVYPHKTTYSHELATAIVFESGITHFADDYKVYLDQPDYVLDFLKKIETVWDESKLLYGYPGDEICVARRNGRIWFAAGLNSLGKNRIAKIDLEFLGEGNYKALIISDGKNDTEFDFKERTCAMNDSIEIDILPFGGYSIYFEKL